MTHLGDSKVKVTDFEILCKSFGFKFLYAYISCMWMDQVDTLLVVRYWSEVLFCTIVSHLGDLDIKVTD